MSPHYLLRWLGCVLGLGLAGCFLFDPVGAAIKKLHHPAAAVRRSAIEALNQRYDDRAIAPLITCLKDEDAGVRQAAIMTLGRWGPAQAVVPICDCLRDASPEVGRTAAETLAVLNDARAVEPLIASLATDDTEFRRAAITALGRLGYARAGKPLLARLQDQDPAIAAVAAEALGGFSNLKVTDALIACLAQESEMIRHSALDALCRIGAPAVKPLIACLKNPQGKGRALAAEALGRIGDARAIGSLIICLKAPVSAAGSQEPAADMNEEEPTGTPADAALETRQKAAEALGKLGHPAVAPLLACLSDQDSAVRGLAATALGQLHDARAIKPLIDCLVSLSAGEAADEEEATEVNVRESLIDALTNLGEPVITPLSTCLQDDNRRLRQDAAEVLDRLHYLPPDADGKAAFFILRQAWDELVKLGAPALKPLLACLDDEVAEIRPGAAEALGRLGDRQAVDPLIKCLQDEAVSVQQNAATALGLLGDRRAVDPLIEAFQNADPMVKRPAAEALGLLGDAKATDVLTGSLKDEDADLRQVCAQALGKLQYHPAQPEDNIVYLIALQSWDEVAKMGAPALEPLGACLSDGSLEVQRGAIAALGEIGDKRAIEPLSGALPDWDLNAELVPVLEQLGWKPASETEKVYAWIGRKDAEHLKAHWEITRRVLLDDVGSSIHRRLKNAVYSFLAIGEPKILDDLVQILDNQDDKDIAETYLNCGNEKLAQAARDWASRNGYMIIPISGSTHTSWGSW
ncbi:MAG: HEAT repeat domain-containing protein [Opitutaceae bacterium]|nr:HEAT repeat domain-containing protein [Opitutaceae bacterium]